MDRPGPGSRATPIEEEKVVVRSAECTGCLACVDACPSAGALRIGLPWLRRDLPWWTYPATVLTLFALGVGWGMANGHRTSSLSPAELRIALGR
jgi:ferredoxin